MLVTGRGSVVAPPLAGERGSSKVTGKKLCYKGSTFHRVVKNFMIQGGDFTEGTASSPAAACPCPFTSEGVNPKPIRSHVQPNQLWISAGNGRGGESIYGGFFGGTDKRSSAAVHSPATFCMSQRREERCMRVLWCQVMDSECAPRPADLRGRMTLLCF